jgi:23S rRNA (guanosine2251-2'-O)-methyltransferase
MGIALVVGNEGEGLRKLVSKSCDHLMRLPMFGKVESLNAAVAGSIALYLARNARN